AEEWATDAPASHGTRRAAEASAPHADPPLSRATRRSPDAAANGSRALTGAGSAPTRRALRSNPSSARGAQQLARRFRPRSEILEESGDDEGVEWVDQGGCDGAFVRPPGCEHSFAGTDAVVARGTELWLAVGEPEPAGGAVALVREPDAARVDEANVTDATVVLLMGVAGYDHGRVDGREHRSPPL